MKIKLLTLLMLLGTFTSLTFAQGEDEFKISYGYSGLDALVPASLLTSYAFSCVFVNTLTITTGVLLGASEPLTVPCHFETKQSGTFAVNYNKRINDKVSLGGQLNISRYKYRTRENAPWKKINLTAPYAKIEYRYINKEKFEMYGGVMLGVIVGNNSDKSILPAIHLTPLGFRCGQQHAAFFELGLGSGHLISTGYSAKI